MRIFGKGKCKFIANFSAAMVTSLPSHSFPSLSLSLSLSHRKYLTHNIGSASALSIIHPVCLVFFFERKKRRKTNLFTKYGTNLHPSNFFPFFWYRVVSGQPLPGLEKSFLCQSQKCIGCHFSCRIFFHLGRNRAPRPKSLGAKKSFFEAIFCTHPDTNIINEMIEMK